MTDVHKYLWETKLKSRNSFLTICEMLPVKEQLVDTLGMLHPNGKEFHEKYVTNNWQFFWNSAHRVDFPVGLDGVENEQHMGL